MNSLRLRCATEVLAANQNFIIAPRSVASKGALRVLTYISMRTDVYGKELASRRPTKLACPLPRRRGKLHNQGLGLGGERYRGVL